MNLVDKVLSLMIWPENCVAVTQEPNGQIAYWSGDVTLVRISRQLSYADSVTAMLRPESCLLIRQSERSDDWAYSVVTMTELAAGLVERFNLMEKKKPAIRRLQRTAQAFGLKCIIDNGDVVVRDDFTVYSKAVSLPSLLDA